MERRIDVRRRAILDLADIAAGITDRVSERTAIRWLYMANRIISSLQFDADQWPQADEAEETNLDLRCRICGRGRQVYRVLFTIEADVVTVYRVRHAAQGELTDSDL